MYILKETLKRIYNVVKRSRDEHKVFRCAKPYLKKGIYYFPHNKHEIKMLDNGVDCIKNILHIGINKGGRGTATSISYGIGCGKAVLLIGDLAYGFYFTEKGYLGSKHNYELNYHLFNYPCITGISFMGLFL